MDEIAKFNRERWEELVANNVRYSRPILDFTPESAGMFLDPYGVMGSVEGKRVLCLASGGGQQSAAFGALGAEVTVLDLSRAQLERDRDAAEHYGHAVDLQEGDMRDLSRFGPGAFDVVYDAHSLGFVPDPREVFDQVRRVLRNGGLYHLAYANPFAHGMMDLKWHGSGYAVLQPFEDGAEMVAGDPYWDVGDGKDGKTRIRGPREWRHALSTVINGLIDRDFSILGVWEEGKGDADAEPGSWPHFQAFFPPWIVLWAERRA